MKDIVLNEKSIWFDKHASEWGTSYEAPHPLHIYLFVYVKCGKIKVFSKDKEFELVKGEMVYIPSEYPFKIELSTQNGGTVIYRANFRFFPNVDNYDYIIQSVPVPASLVGYMEELMTFDRSFVNSEFIWKAYRFLDEAEKLMKKNQDLHIRKIEKALDYMREHDHYTIPELAKMCNMSRSGFYAVFQEVVGDTPIRTKHRFQAYKAELLLKSTELSIDEIAEKVGFSSTAHFRKVFYSRYHCSPHEIRRRMKEEAKVAKQAKKD